MLSFLIRIFPWLNRFKKPGEPVIPPKPVEAIVVVPVEPQIIEPIEVIEDPTPKPVTVIIRPKDKEWDTFVHVRRRVRERYNGLEIEFQTYRKWNTLIQNDSFLVLNLFTKDSSGDLYLIKYGPVDIFAICRDNRVVTVVEDKSKSLHGLIQQREKERMTKAPVRLRPAGKTSAKKVGRGNLDAQPKRPIRSAESILREKGLIDPPKRR
jgi:hypothetical protein